MLLAAACEPGGAWPWTEPASALSSLAFVIAGGVILRRHTTLGILAMLIGVGSLVQHGPAPTWNPVVHDPPLMGAVAFVGATAAADLSGRRLRAWWWLAPVAADVVLAAVAPRVSAGAQVAVAVAAISATLVRAARRPEIRLRTLVGLGLLGTGGVIGRLSRPGWPLCDPGGWFGLTLSGHAAWHVAAAAALVVLAPTLTPTFTTTPTPTPSHTPQRPRVSGV